VSVSIIQRGYPCRGSPSPFCRRGAPQLLSVTTTFSSFSDLSHRSDYPSYMLLIRWVDGGRDRTDNLSITRWLYYRLS